jgi:hypothetical protein
MHHWRMVFLLWLNLKAIIAHMHHHGGFGHSNHNHDSGLDLVEISDSNDPCPSRPEFVTKSSFSWLAHHFCILLGISASSLHHSLCHSLLVSWSISCWWVCFNPQIPRADGPPISTCLLKPHCSRLRQSTAVTAQPERELKSIKHWAMISTVVCHYIALSRVYTSLFVNILVSSLQCRILQEEVLSVCKLKTENNKQKLVFNTFNFRMKSTLWTKNTKQNL